MNYKNNPSFIAWRFYLVSFVISLAVAGLVWRVFNLAVIDQHFLRQQGDERILRLVSTPAFRGMIVDRNGFPLAISTTVYSAWMNPQEFSASSNELSALADLMKMNPQDISLLLQLNQKKKREFVYLKRALSPEIAQKIKELGITGVYLQQEYRRYYPEGEAAAQVVGFTNVDDNGQEGLELGYNNWLAGEVGKKWVIKDRMGRVISDVQLVKDQQPGHDLVLSIDRRIQYLAYRELLTAIIQNKAISGSVIVLDVRTGEILAMANYPSINPNNRPAHMSDGFRNRAVTDSFEPGSTIKAFTVTSALESGLFKPNSVIDTSPGYMRVGHSPVRDEKNNGLLSIAQILQISSNMGAAKMVLAMPPNQLFNVLHRVGFGEVTGIGYPGEQNGLLVPRPAGSFPLVTLSFGYGMSATLMQIARAYSVLANSGIKLPISLLRLDQAPSGEQVIDSRITKQMLALLETVVQSGTATRAQVPGYRIAGKTGTTKLVGENGYQKHHHSSSFVGIAPLSHPRLIVAIIIHDPQGKHYLGGEVSGPVFEKIMEGTLRIMDVPPDAQQTPSQ